DAPAGLDEEPEDARRDEDEPEEKPRALLDGRDGAQHLRLRDPQFRWREPNGKLLVRVCRPLLASMCRRTQQAGGVRAAVEPWQPSRDGPRAEPSVPYIGVVVGEGAAVLL